MEKEVMEKIKKYAIEECTRFFDYAGCAEGDDFVMINSGNKKELKIKITLSGN